MIGSSFLFDTNIIINLFKEKGTSIAPLVVNNNIFVSIITKIELLGYHKISEIEEKSIRSLLDLIEVVDLDSDISDIAINLRQSYNLKTADSIIAATAVALDIPLISKDSDFKKIKEIEFIEYT